MKALIIHIVCEDEVHHFIDRIILKRRDNVINIQELDSKTLAHHCSPRYLRRINHGNGPDYVYVESQKT